MLAFGAIVLSILLAYRAMSLGLLPVLCRCAIGIVAIAIGAGVAGGLRNAIPAKFECLQGGCFIVISLGVYLVMRGVVMYHMLERDVPLPSLADRFGGGICGFFGGLMLCGYICMVVLVFMPAKRTGFVNEMRDTAQYGVAPVRLVALFAGTEQEFASDKGTKEEPTLQILLDNILFIPPSSSASSAPQKKPAAPSQPKTAPAVPAE